jgi:hypothetical protein
MPIQFSAASAVCSGRASSSDGLTTVTATQQQQ